MTFVGKILVIVIMVFAVLFLGLSVVVFTTETNWKLEANKHKTEIGKLQEKVTRAKGEADASAQLAANAKGEADKAVANAKAQNDRLQQEIDQRAREIQDVREKVGTAQENVRSAQQETEARTKEAVALRDLLKKVQNEADALKLRQTELNQEILTLKRQIEVAQGNNKDLRERVAILQTAVRKAGLNVDSVMRGGLQPTVARNDVEGEVTKVDTRNRTIEISVGSDDGLNEGNELEIYRYTPTPDYLGRLRITSVDPDHAVGTVIANPNGKKIKEGDHVATKIRPRG